MTFPGNGGRGLPPKRKSNPLERPVKIRWDASKTVAENASEKLPELARSFFAGGEMASRADAFKTLHRFRLLTKRFRYTLELFRPCYGPGLDVRIDALRVLQQDLGEINDCATTLDLVTKRDDLQPAQRDWLAGNLDMLAAARIARFRKHWQEEFTLPGRERRWAHYLARYAGRRRK